MKTFLSIALLFISGVVLAQTETKWSLGIGATPSLSGTTFALYANRQISNHWQVGVMPFGWVHTGSDPYAKTSGYSLGLNLNTRYSPIRWKILEPYTYAFGGIGHTKNRVETINYSNTQTLTYTNLSIGLGTQVLLGSKGWSVDVNGGYLWYNSINANSTFRQIIYSIGLFKRF